MSQAYQVVITIEEDEIKELLKNAGYQPSEKNLERLKNIKLLSKLKDTYQENAYDELEFLMNLEIEERFLELDEL